MLKPSFADYVRLIYALFERFEQEEITTRRPSHAFAYVHKLVSFCCLELCIRLPPIG